MAEHTPGPWGIAVAHPCSKRIKARVGPAEGYALIAEVTSIADARLIAAAPELLEASRIWVGAFDAIDPDEADAIMARALKLSKAAIAKTEGREP